MEWHRADDSVSYDVFAFARPADPLVELGPPFVRMIQRRFAAASLHDVAHHGTFQFPRGCRTPFREALRFIVIAVTSVMRGAFPDTNGVFYMTVDSWRVRGPSRHWSRYAIYPANRSLWRCGKAP